MDAPITRRRLMQQLALASLALPAADSSWSQTKLGRSPFGLGVASGSATHDSVVLWTRLFDPGLFGSHIPNQPLTVKWEMAQDAQFSRLVQTGIAQALPGLAHSVHAEVQGLPADQWFFFRFKAGNFTSPVGRTRTFAAPGQPGSSLKVAVASCQHYGLGYFNAYAHMAREQPDLVVFLGDYIYEYPTPKAAVRTVDSTWCVSLEDYRKRHALYKQDQDLQTMHASCPWLLTWDDHEVQNDYAGIHPGSGGPFNGHFLDRRTAAYQAYYEHMPLRASVLMEGLQGLERGAELRLYAHHRFGNLLAISMLDGRQYRDPQVCTPDGKQGSGMVAKQACTALQSDTRTMLGQAQTQWLSEQLAHSRDHTWNILAQATLFGPRVIKSATGDRVWNDGWDGYPAARQQLIEQLIRHRVPNAVFWGGDVHANWVGHVKTDYERPDSANVGVEFCGTSISSYDAKDSPAARRANPHFIYSESTRKGYAIADISHTDMQVHLRAVKDHRVPVTDLETLASFRVRAGTPQIERTA